MLIYFIVGFIKQFENKRYNARLVEYLITFRNEFDKFDYHMTSRLEVK